MLHQPPTRQALKETQMHAGRQAGRQGGRAGGRVEGGTERQVVFWKERTWW